MVAVAGADFCAPRHTARHGRDRGSGYPWGRAASTVGYERITAELGAEPSALHQLGAGCAGGTTWPRGGHDPRDRIRRVSERLFVSARATSPCTPGQASWTASRNYR